MHTNVLSEFAAFEANLRRCLPEQLMHPLLSHPGLDTARPCNDHLGALLHSVSTYLPRYLVNEQLRDRQPGQVSGQFRQATIMFADISGFTAMSEPGFSYPGWYKVLVAEYDGRRGCPGGGTPPRRRRGTVPVGDRGHRHGARVPVTHFQGVYVR